MELRANKKETNGLDLSDCLSLSPLSHAPTLSAIHSLCHLLTSSWCILALCNIFFIGSGSDLTPANMAMRRATMRRATMEALALPNHL